MNLLALSGGIIALIVVGAILFLILIVAIMFMSFYNGFVAKRNNVKEGFSTMDVHLKKRYDLIPNLVSTVKGYAKHEKETLEKVIQARNMAVNATTVEEKLKNDNILTGTLKSLFALSESYPDLKADRHFLDLQSQLEKLESEIASSRKYYNATVKIYNNALEKFPGNLFAKLYKFTKAEMYEITEVNERKNVKVEF
jgi:LemA protein